MLLPRILITGALGLCATFLLVRQAYAADDQPRDAREIVRAEFAEKDRQADEQTRAEVRETLEHRRDRIYSEIGMPNLFGREKTEWRRGWSRRQNANWNRSLRLERRKAAIILEEIEAATR